MIYTHNHPFSEGYAQNNKKNSVTLTASSIEPTTKNFGKRLMREKKRSDSFALYNMKISLLFKMLSFLLRRLVQSYSLRLNHKVPKMLDQTFKVLLGQL